MAQLTRRMIDPDAFTNPDLEPTAKRMLFIGIMQLCEDSGCCPWDAALIRGLLFTYTSVSKTQIQRHMDALEEADLAWTYRANGKLYAFIPAFPVWNRSITRWNAPKAVPLPPGIQYEPIEDPKKRRQGSGKYAWPASHSELTSKGTETSEVSESNLSESKEPDEQADEQPDNRDDSHSKPEGKTAGQTTARRRSIDEVDV